MAEKTSQSEKPEQKTAEKYIELNSFLRVFAKAEGSGGQVKLIIRGGNVKVNGEVDTRNKRKLFGGEVIEYLGKTYSVNKEELR